MKMILNILCFLIPVGITISLWSFIKKSTFKNRLDIFFKNYSQKHKGIVFRILSIFMFVIFLLLFFAAITTTYLAFFIYTTYLQYGLLAAFGIILLTTLCLIYIALFMEEI